LWFIEAFANKIGKISPTNGSVTEYNIPTANARPYDGITAGTDGNLWFTEPQGNKIARISLSTGEITEYEVPTANAGPYGIAAGSDGNLWFTELNSNKISKLSPATGEITGYALPTDNVGPYGIAAGPDGNLWFTESTQNKIGYISPATGETTEFNIPTADSSPYAITKGPDGNLWFTQSTQNEIGKISPANGSVTKYSLATSTTTTTGSQQLIEVISVFGPVQPFNPGGPMVEITLKNVSAEPVIALTAVFTELGPHKFTFDFAVTPETPLVSYQTISAKLILINGAFENNFPYHLTIKGTLQNGKTFTYTTQQEIIEPPNQ
jgi:streptogramin lyase